MRAYKAVGSLVVFVMLASKALVVKGASTAWITVSGPDPVPASITLNAPGTLDWVYFGSPTGAVQEGVSGPGTTHRSRLTYGYANGESTFTQLHPTDFPGAFSWTDGSTIPSGIGVTQYPQNVASTGGGGWGVLGPVAEDQMTVKFYVSVFDGTGHFDAHLGSSVHYADAIPPPPDLVSAPGALATAVYTVNYAFPQNPSASNIPFVGIWTLTAHGSDPLAGVGLAAAVLTPEPSSFAVFGTVVWLSCIRLRNRRAPANPRRPRTSSPLRSKI